MLMGALSGLVNGTESIVFDWECTGSAVSSINTGNILNGDEDGWYTIILRYIGGSATASLPWVRWNNDSGANYGYRGISASSTTVANINSTGEVQDYLGHISIAQNNSALSIYRIYAKSGAVRLANQIVAVNISGTTIDTLYARGSVWSNTADNIINATFGTTQTNGYGVGSRLIILKSNNFTNGTPTGVITTPYIKGAWVRVGSQILTSTSSSVVFSGLDGDRDVIYYLSWMAKGTGNCDTIQMTYNAAYNAGSTSYGTQNLVGTSTSVSAFRTTNYPYIPFGNIASSSNYAMGSRIVFAKSGFIRPSLASFSDDISGTTVTATRCISEVYNNTATNITSIYLQPYFTAVPWAVGSQFDLYALRPNG